MENSNPAKLIRIHPDDNVGVLSRSVQAGDMIDVEGSFVNASSDFGLGHKFALKEILPRGKIYKYGISIGSAVEAIGKGAHVHLHNIQSDYLPTFTLDNERNFNG